MFSVWQLCQWDTSLPEPSMLSTCPTGTIFGRRFQTIDVDPMSSNEVMNISMVAASLFFWAMNWERHFDLVVCV